MLYTQMQAYYLVLCVNKHIIQPIRLASMAALMCTIVLVHQCPSYVEILLLAMPLPLLLLKI